MFPSSVSVTPGQWHELATLRELIAPGSVLLLPQDAFGATAGDARNRRGRGERFSGGADECERRCVYKVGQLIQGERGVPTRDVLRARPRKSEDSLEHV